MIDGMIPLTLVGEHLFALVMIWMCAILAGMPLAALLRIRLGIGAAMMLGVAYWSVSLYVLPFSGGLLLTMAIAVAALIALWLRRAVSPPVTRGWQPLSWPNLVLFLGCSSYATILFTNYVPPGMDGSMHMTSARLIAEQTGLPRNYAPFAPELVFPAVNLGLPTLAAVTMRLGCTPAAAMLAAEQLTFSAFILATYLVLRLWTTGLTAAWLAVLAAWSSRNMQETIGWGGFPTVMSLALGLLAARLLIDVLRRPALVSAVPAGILIASLPLVHGVSAAVWIYAVAPVALIVALVRSRCRKQGLLTLSAAAVVACMMLAAYRVFGHVAVSDADLAWTRDWQQGYAPKMQGWTAVFMALNYLRSQAGSMTIWVGLLAIGMLCWRRQQRSVAALAAIALLLAMLIINVHYWTLPLSMLLYPERVAYWGTPLAALAIALGLRTVPGRQRSLLATLVVTGLLCPAGVRHWSGYQQVAVHPQVTRAAWQALDWAAHHLDAEHDYVASAYSSAGSYLPGVAGIATSGWHAHHFIMEEAQAVLQTRPVTHVFVLHGPLPPGEVVYHNADAAIIRIPSSASTAAKGAPSRR